MASAAGLSTFFGVPSVSFDTIIKGMFDDRDIFFYQSYFRESGPAVSMRYELLSHRMDEAAVRHELDTYNELLGGRGELGATLLIEITEPATSAPAAWRR